MQKLLWIGFAGVFGALARYSLADLVHRFNDSNTFLGTVVVNMLGCFAFGLVWSLAEGRLGFGAEARLIVLTGFMGAFTTFSSFIFETGTLLRNAEWQLAMLNLLGQNMVSLIFLYIGVVLGRLF